MIIEKWLPVVGMEGLYEVSDHGRVRSVERKIVRRNGVSCAVSERILQPSKKNKTGHLNLTLWRVGRRRTVAVHIVVLEAFVGPCPLGLECCHSDGVAANNHLSNLRWDTPESNGRDRMLHGVTRARQTRCKRGHEFSVENTIRHGPNGQYRRCRTCQLEANRRYYRKKMAA